MLLFQSLGFLHFRFFDLALGVFNSSCLHLVVLEQNDLRLQLLLFDHSLAGCVSYHSSILDFAHLVVGCWLLVVGFFRFNLLQTSH